MAKYDPYNDLPHPDRTIVNSRAYGEHTRARRGANRPVEINNTFKLHNQLLTGANKPAKLVKNEIDYYRGGFPSGQLWQFLVGMFKKQLKLKLPLNVDELLYKDINQYYPMTRLLKQGFRKVITLSESSIKLDFENLNPQFRRQSLDGYQVEVACVYFDFVQMDSCSDSEVSPIVPLNYAGLLSFELDKGKPGDRYLILVKITGCYKGIVQSENPVTAMQVIHTGILS